MLSLALSANADILVFKTSTSGQQLDVENKVLSKKSEHGYLVINADLSNPDSALVNEADYLHYEKKGTAKSQFTQLLDTNDVEIIIVNFSKTSKKMVLRWFDQSTGSYSVVYGTATSKDIGGIIRYTPVSLLGNSVWRQVDFRTGSGSVKLTMDKLSTKNANLQGTSVQDVVSSFEQILQTQGYSAE